MECRRAEASAEERSSKRAASGPSLEGMTVEKLKVLLKENGLPTKGKKVAASTKTLRAGLGVAWEPLTILDCEGDYRTNCWSGLEAS